MFIPKEPKRTLPKRKKLKKVSGVKKPQPWLVENFVAADRQTLLLIRNGDCEIETIEIKLIKDHDGLKIRDKYSEETLRRLTAKLRDGEELPPVILVRAANGNLYMLDGDYRLLAHRRCRRTVIKAAVISREVEDALRLRLLANADHPTPLTSAEKRRIVRSRLLDISWWRWSDKVIAIYCGASDGLVGNIRNEILSEQELSAKYSQITTRLCLRRGNMYEMNVAPINAERAREKAAAKDSRASRVHNAELINKEIKVQPGEVFLFYSADMPFPHVLYCGDARDERFYQIVFAREKAGLIKVDFPYNVDYTGSGFTNDANCNPCDKLANDNLPQAEYWELIDGTLAVGSKYTKPGSGYVVWCGLKETETVKTLCEQHLGERRDELIWIKKGLRQGGSHFNKMYEKALFGWTGNSLRCWNGGYDASNVFDENVLEQSAHELKRQTHPCPKPVTVYRRMIELLLEPSGLVLDQMVGSGTTMVAAHLVERVGIGIEIKEEFVAVAASRMQELLPFCIRTTIDNLAAALARFNRKSKRTAK